MDLKNNDLFYDKYKEVTSKLENLADDVDIKDVFATDIMSVMFRSEYESSAVYNAYYDFFKNNPDKDKDGSVTKKCEEFLSLQFKSEYVKNNFKTIIKDEVLLSNVLKAGDEQALQTLYNESKAALANGEIEADVHDKLVEKLKDKGINISLETLSDEELSNKYTKAGADKKQIGETIDALTAQNLKDAIQEHKENGPKRKTNISEEKIMEKVDALGLSSEDKKIVINFVVDPSVGERKTTPITSLSKDKFRSLRNTITKYLKWLEEKNLKVEPEELINDKGEKQTVVYIKNGEIFNITLSCTNLVKEGINKGVEKMKKAKDNIEDTRGGVKNALSKISKRRKLRKEILKNKLKQKFAPIVDYAGTVAEKLSKKADDFGHKAHDRADEMKNAEVTDLQERLERLKKKNGVAVGGNTVEFMGPPENQAGMSI